MSEFNIDAFKKLLQQPESSTETPPVYILITPTELSEQQPQTTHTEQEQWHKGFQQAVKERAAIPTVQMPTIVIGGNEFQKKRRGGTALALVAGALLLSGGYFYQEDIRTYLNSQKAQKVTEQGAGGSPVYKRFDASSKITDTEQQLIGYAPMIEQQNSGNFTYSDTTIAWNVLVQSPDSSVFSIEIAVMSPAGGYEPDARLSERIASGDMSNQEIALFLVQNNIVPATGSAPSLFIELVGRSVSATGERNVIHKLQLMP